MRITNMVSPPGARVTYPRGTPRDVLAQLPITKEDIINLTGMCYYLSLDTHKQIFWCYVTGQDARQVLNILTIPPNDDIEDDEEIIVILREFLGIIQ